VRRLLDIYTILAIALLNTAFIFTYELHKYPSGFYLYIVFPGIVSGFLIALYSKDIRKSMLISIATIILTIIILSLLLSTPVLLGIIPKDIVNAFLFLSIKRAVNSIIFMVMPLIVSMLVFSSIIGGILGE